jgi:hypothetical protein
VTSRRELYHVPVVHAEADLGGLLSPVREATIMAQGPDAWRRKRDLIAAMWTRVQAWAASLPTDLSGWKIYQDGLPLCGRELDIVRDLATQRSVNHQLVLDLVSRGAQLMGTESPELLLREYELVRQALSGGTGFAERGREVLLERDRFIASRIDATLTPAAPGIVFIGALHALGPALPPDIIVHDLTYVLSDPEARASRLEA